MARIKVNTQQLINEGSEIEGISGEFEAISTILRNAAANVKSYDGQLSGPALKAGLEAAQEAKNIRTSLENNGGSLRRTGEAFERAENEAIYCFTNAGMNLSNFRSPNPEYQLAMLEADPLYEEYHGIWFTWNNDSWNPFRNGMREEVFGGTPSSDSNKWIGYEDVSDNPDKVVIWFNPLPPNAQPDPPYLPRVFDKNDPDVEAFLQAIKYLELAHKLMDANSISVPESILNAIGFVGIKVMLDCITGIGGIFLQLLEYTDYIEACKLFDEARSEAERLGQKLFSSDTPYEPYMPHGEEKFEPMPG